MGRGSAGGAGTIINAIATWKGCAFGVELETHARVTLTRGGKVKGEVEGGGDPRLIENCVKIVLEHFGKTEMGGEIRTTSQIPAARGLKSSSAAANAAVLATLDALGEEMEAEDAIRLGVIAAKKTGVTITGAYDDACASMLGGIVTTDNRKMKLLRRVEKEGEVLILVPQRRAYTAKTNVKNSKLLAPYIEMAYQLALEEKYWEAMTLNGLLYCAALGFSPTPILLALEAGVLGASLSGTGPAYTAIGNRESLDLLEKRWADLGAKVIRTRINNRGYA